MRPGDSFYEQFLDELAMQMQQAPGGEDPYLKRLMEARMRDIQQRKLRPREGREGVGAVIEGLGRLYGGGLSLALTGDTNPLDAIQGLIEGSKAAKERVVAGDRDPMNALSMIPMRGAIQKGHGARVREELIAKRAAKGPRKPGGGRRPAAKIVEPAPVEPEQDLLALLAASVAKPPAPAPATPARGGLKSLLFRLGRNR